MKAINTSKFIIAAAVLSILLMFSVAAFADENCNNIKDIAATIMKYRQEGATYSSMYSVALKNDAMAGGELEQIFVKRAFLEPRLYDMQARELLISNFSQGVYERCIQATSK